jgi:hypothetical protein
MRAMARQCRAVAVCDRHRVRAPHVVRCARCCAVPASHRPSWSCSAVQGCQRPQATRWARRAQQAAPWRPRACARLRPPASRSHRTSADHRPRSRHTLPPRPASRASRPVCSANTRHAWQTLVRLVHTHHTSPCVARASTPRCVSAHSRHVAKARESRQ